MAQLKFLPNIPIQYKINNNSLKSVTYTDQAGNFNIQAYQGDTLTVFIYDNQNNYIPIHFTAQSLVGDQIIDIQMIKKQIQQRNTKISNSSDA